MVHDLSTAPISEARVGFVVKHARCGGYVLLPLSCQKGGGHAKRAAGGSEQ